jgi:microcystin-dependent protein
MNAGMATAVVAVAGGGQAHENRQPYLCLNYCIALEGIFPSRN